MKKIIKSIAPPLILNKLQYIKKYKLFLQYRNLVAKNVELKDKHKGERCFILGSGPSIKKENLKPLKNEIVFALNNFYVHEYFDIIMSGEKAKYYMTAPIHPPQIEDEWREWFEDMEKFVPKNTNMLFGLNSYSSNIKYILDKYGIFKGYKINWYYTGVKTDEYYIFNRKDINITNMIWGANTVSIYALINAIYMGFDEIYLLGMDHNYICKSRKKWRFYKNAIHQKNEIKKNTSSKSYTQRGFESGSKIFKQYQILKNNCNNTIFNCSSNSLLDIFIYKNFTKMKK